MGPRIRKAHGSGSGAAGSGHDTRRQPLSGFPEVLRLAEHEPWLVGSEVRAERVWEHAGTVCDIVRRGRARQTLLVLIQGRESWVYLRLYDTHALAVADGKALASEILRQPPRIGATWGDPARSPWCVRVVERAHHAEVQVFTSGLIPQTRVCASVNEAELQAEAIATRHNLR